ncbi:hypothetical protein E2C01_057807 [Portunus trituberculatus]|uniref:Uncharacterized protein n=1 Tax=Portunus trituberculatus TaxID=210409 RepID=A0A5B7H244_PORTR|nr:hypothetical protein [Portunus trituberculatus]
MNCRGASRVANSNSRLVRTQTQKTQGPGSVQAPALTELLRKSREKIREVARVIGLLVAAIPAVELGKLHYRQLEMAKITALQTEKGNFDRWMVITEGMKTNLC